MQFLKTKKLYLFFVICPKSTFYCKLEQVGLQNVPVLSHLAKTIFCIPASTAQLDRLLEFFIDASERPTGGFH